MCPGGLISPILHSHYPKSSSFFLDSSHSHFPCSQMISPYRLQEKNEASVGFHWFLISHPYYFLPFSPRKEWLSPSSESCPFLPFQWSFWATYHTPSPSGDLSSSFAFLPSYGHMNMLRIFRSWKKHCNLFSTMCSSTTGPSIHPSIHSTNAKNTYHVPGTILSAGVQQWTKESPDSHGTYMEGDRK